MHDAARNGKGLARLERDRFTLKFNIEMPFHDQEKLVGIIMPMPVEVTFHDAQADPSIVDLAKGPIPPRRLSLPYSENVEVLTLLEHDTVCFNVVIWFDVCHH